MLASVKQAAARLERFLAARHEGDPLDRPVLDFLAGFALPPPALPGASSSSM